MLVFDIANPKHYFKSASDTFVNNFVVLKFSFMWCLNFRDKKKGTDVTVWCMCVLLAGSLVISL